MSPLATMKPVTLDQPLTSTPIRRFDSTHGTTSYASTADAPSTIAIAAAPKPFEMSQQSAISNPALVTSNSLVTSTTSMKVLSFSDTGVPAELNVSVDEDEGQEVAEEDDRLVIDEDPQTVSFRKLRVCSEIN